ncbi:hypothetical protein QBC40DRAFT_166645 [Triangularia verruculosa]|uniref:Uncharacterized protein n=1 Tax=Triangularia verruculosa TaxID=2587418 RepID=A0AAN6XS51_9PEZI|nr:hypothetical protein QBC40DRAFT_166645 [Triangularia verruculosa]
MYNLAAEHLVPLPEHRLRQLFKLMSPIMTFVQWQILADAIYIHTSRTGTPHDVKPYHWKEDSTEPSELPRFIQRMQPNPGSLHFLTILNIKNVEKFDTIHLLPLTELRSLVILRMEDNGVVTTPHSEFGCYKPSMNLNDRLIRGWSDKEQPFPALRSLILLAMPGSLSLHMLRYATKFPQLQKVYVNSPLTSPRPAIGHPLQGVPAWMPVECHYRPCWDTSLKYQELGLGNPYTTMTFQPPVELGQVNNKALLRSLSLWEFARNWEVEMQIDEKQPLLPVSQPKRKAVNEGLNLKAKSRRKIGDLLSSFGSETS